jgi:hypothetical protein
VDTVAGVKLRMLQEAFDRVHIGIGNGSIVEPLDHLLNGKFRELLFDQRLKRVAILHALRIVSKARIARERRVLQHLRAQRGPFARILNAEEHDSPVAASERAVGRDGGVTGAGADQRLAGAIGVIGGIAHPFGHGIEQRNLERHALARALAVEQRHQHAVDDVHAGRGIDDGDAAFRRLFLGAVDRQESGFALHQ